MELNAILKDKLNVGDNVVAVFVLIFHSRVCTNINLILRTCRSTQVFCCKIGHQKRTDCWLWLNAIRHLVCLSSRRPGIHHKHLQTLQ